MVRKRRFIGLLFGFLFITLFIGLSVFVARQQVRLIPRAQQQSTPEIGAGKVAVSQRLSNYFKKEPQGKTEAIVQLESSQNTEDFKNTPLSKLKENREKFVREKKMTASTIQFQVRKSLEKAVQADEVKKDDIEILDSFWIINALHVRISKTGLEKLAKTPGVVRIIDNIRFSLPEPKQETSPHNSSFGIEWNIAKIRAPEVWAAGIEGQGITVASLDTGVSWEHPTLKEKYRGWNKDGIADHNYNWFDVINGKTEPYDDNFTHYHGTHTTGTMVGSEETTNQIGVAPGAKWVAVKVLGSDGGAPFSTIINGMEWTVAPYPVGGNKDMGDTSKAPDVVNNSWGAYGINSCDPRYPEEMAAMRQAVTNWRNTGIIPIFALGNEGPDTETARSPGDLPEAIGVGATDNYDNIADFSSRGPSCFDEIKPDVSAPGVDIRSSIGEPGYFGYDMLSGTSMAAPHVAGFAALLLSWNPNLTVNELEDIMKSTSLDLGDRGPDNEYGAGRIDALMVFDVGTLNGRVTSSGAPLPNVKINIQSNTSNYHIYTDAQGNFTTKTPSGDYQIYFSKIGYYDEIRLIKVIKEQTIRLNIDMKLLPVYTLSGTITKKIDSQTTPVESATVTVLNTQLTPVQTDASGRYLINNIPRGNYEISVNTNCCRSSTKSIVISNNSSLDFVFNDYVLMQDFENGLGSWTTEGAGDPRSSWYTFKAWGCIIPHGGSYVANYGMPESCGYSTLTPSSGSLISPVFTVPNLDNIEFSFWMYQWLGSGATRSLQLKEEGTPAWITLDQFATDPRTSWKWSLKTYNLNAYRGKRIQVKFFFDTGNPYPPQGAPGWFIDDVIVGRRLADVTVRQVGPATILPDNTLTFQVKYENIGDIAAENVVLNNHWEIPLGSAFVISPEPTVNPTSTAAGGSALGETDYRIFSSPDSMWTPDPVQSPPATPTTNLTPLSTPTSTLPQHRPTPTPNIECPFGGVIYIQNRYGLFIKDSRINYRTLVKKDGQVISEQERSLAQGSETVPPFTLPHELRGAKAYITLIYPDDDYQILTTRCWNSYAWSQQGCPPDIGGPLVTLGPFDIVCNSFYYYGWIAESTIPTPTHRATPTPSGPTSTPSITPTPTITPTPSATDTPTPTPLPNCLGLKFDCSILSPGSISLDKIKYDKWIWPGGMAISRNDQVVYKGDFVDSYLDSSLQPDTNYNYKVGCCQNCNTANPSYSGWSGPLTCKTSRPAPGGHQGDLSIPVGTLAPYETRTFNLKFKVDPSAKLYFSNIANITTSSTELSNDNNESSIMTFVLKPFSWVVKSKAICPSDGWVPPQNTRAFFTYWPPDPLTWQNDNVWASGLHTVSLTSNNPQNAIYLGLEAEGGLPQLQPIGTLPNPAIHYGKFFGAYMTRWFREELPSGVYEINFQAPDAWCNQTRPTVTPTPTITATPIPTITNTPTPASDLPDLIVKDITRDNVNYWVECCNIGNTTNSSTFRINLTNKDTGQSSESPPYNIPDPKTCRIPGGPYCNWIGDPTCNANITVEAMVDSQNTVVEVDESNNTFQKTFTSVPTPTATPTTTIPTSSITPTATYAPTPTNTITPTPTNTPTPTPIPTTAPACNLIGENFSINDNYEKGRTSTRIAYNSRDNRFLVVWHEKEERDDTFDVYSQMMSADGTRIGYSRPLGLGYDGKNQKNPAVAYNSVQNEFLIVWEDNNTIVRGYDIRGQRINSNGLPIGTVTPIISRPDYQGYETDQQVPTLVYNPDKDEYLLAWQDNYCAPYPYRTENNIYGVRVSSTTLAGISNYIPIAVTSTGCNNNTIHHNPTIAYDINTHQYLVAWEEYTSQFSGWNIFGQYISDDGILNGGACDMVYIAGNQRRPSIVYNNQNQNYLLAYESDGNIYARRVNAANCQSGLYSPFKINTISGNQFFPSAVYNPPNNQYAVVWQDAKNYRIYGRRIAANETLLGNECTFSNVGQQQASWVSFNSQSGEYFVVWADNRINPRYSDYGLYGQRWAPETITLTSPAIGETEGISIENIKENKILQMIENIIKLF